MLEEVGESVLVRCLLDGSDVGGEVELRPVGRLTVMHYIIGQPVLQLSLFYGRVIRQLLVLCRQ